MCVHLCKKYGFVTCLQTVSTGSRRLVCRRSSTDTARCAVDGRATDDDEVQSSTTVENEQPTSPAVIAVLDVTGATFTRQCAYLRGLRPTSQLPVTELDSSDDDDHSIQFSSVIRGRPPSSRRLSTSSADYGFTVAAGVVRRVPSVSVRQQTTVESAETMNRRRAMSETREYRRRRQEMTSSSSTTTAPSAAAAVATGQQSRGRTTVRQLKRKNNRPTATLLSSAAGNDNSRICSWRHSLCAGFKSSKCEMEDLWTESRPDANQSRLPSTTSSITISVVACTPRTTPPSRSQSLPRSFRSSFIAPLRRLLSSRSLNSASDVDTGSSGVERPASVVSATTTANAQPPTKGKHVERSRSLERGSSRETQQQRSIARAASLNSRSAMSSQSRRNASVSSSSSSGPHEVYVEIPDQPWTRPFATVRLRPHHAGDVDRYQSSSGRLLHTFVSV